MNPRQNGRHPHSRDRQHQRFSWQTPPATPPEQESQASQQPPQRQPQQQPARINTNLDGQHGRAFSYAQTPAEHLAFQYIPSPSEFPPLPSSQRPIDPRLQSASTPHNNPPTQPQAQHTYPPTRPDQQPASPLSPHDRSNPPPFSRLSPVAEPPRVYTDQVRPQQTQHARNLSNLSPINTNVGLPRMPPVPNTPYSHHSQADELPHKAPITPISPSSIKKDPIECPLPMSPNSRKSYAHEPYSPHGFSTPPPNAQHAVFSPDSAHGPNGLDFALHQPGQITHPNMDFSPSGTTHSWKHALCSCNSDISTCLTGFFCPCILYGRTSYRLSQKSSKQDPTDLLSYKATNGHCVMMALSCGFWWLFPMIQRTRLRHMYKLEGGLAGDCVRGLCCCCCVAVQNEKEVKGREEAKRQWAGPASSEVYKSPGQMRYAPQH